MVDAGLTGELTEAVKPASVYHVNVPVAQVAAKVLEPPVQITVGDALAVVGAAGVIVSTKTIVLVSE